VTTAIKYPFSVDEGFFLALGEAKTVTLSLLPGVACLFAAVLALNENIFALPNPSFVQ